MNLKKLAELHRHTVHNCDACHTKKCSEGKHDRSCLMCVEGRWIAKYSDYALESVCEECFSNPDNGGL